MKLRRHPVLLIHALGIFLVWIANAVNGGYDGSVLGSLAFFAGSAMNFLGWIITEISYFLFGNNVFVSLHPWLPNLLALGGAYLIDYLFFSERRVRNDSAEHH